MIIQSALNAALSIPFTFEDDFAALVTGKVDGDFTKAAYLAATPATTATASVAAVSGQSGDYAVTLAANELDALGLWRVNVSCTLDATVYRFGWTISVYAAAADPAALATAVAAVQTTVDTIDGNVDVAVSTRASAAVWTPTIAGRIDVAVSTRATPGGYFISTLDVPSTATDVGGRVIYQGDAYTADHGRELTFTVETELNLAEVGAEIGFTLVYPGGTIEKVVQATLDTGNIWVITLELTKEDTTALEASGLPFDLSIVFQNGDPVTLGRGTFTVVPEIS